MEEQIKNEIKRQLLEVEMKEDVRIILAIESGSRACGFASPDSDYDVRFIYVRKPEDYLRLEKIRDVIEWQLDDVYDINGWDLRKALQLMYGSNPTLLEWCKSPIVYKSTSEADELRLLAQEYFSPIKGFYHYLHTAKRAYQGDLTSDMVKIKKYLYVLRPLLCASWIEKYGTQPPMLFSDLVETVMEPELISEVNRLLEIKRNAGELEIMGRNEIFTEYIERKLEHFQAISSRMGTVEKSWEALDAYFNKCVYAA